MITNYRIISFLFLFVISHLTAYNLKKKTSFEYDLSQEWMVSDYLYDELPINSEYCPNYSLIHNPSYKISPSDLSQNDRSNLDEAEVLSNAYNPALLDLEQWAQDFVLETKQIEIPGYPGALNPSIVRWDNSLLLSFRIRDPKTKRTDGIGLIHLDEEFNLIGDPQILSIEYSPPLLVSKQQDPRLVQVGKRLFMVYNNVVDPINHPELRRMYYVELLYDGQLFHPQSPQIITEYPNQITLRSEKNWVPFDYKDQLLLAYSIHPHLILHPIEGTPVCEFYKEPLGCMNFHDHQNPSSFKETKVPIEWPWGILRGGTPALKIGDEYLAFFHSSIYMPSLHSQGKKILHYFMAAYTFSATPPFELTRISPFPIIGKTFYSGPAYKTWKPLRVVFPGGYIMDDKYIHIIYGKQDFEMWVARLDKQKLLDSLISVSLTPDR